MKNFILTLLFLFIAFNNYTQNHLPFEVNSKEYNHLKQANTNFKDGKYKKAKLEYDSCTIITQHFPLEQYKQALAQYMTKDSVEAKKTFYNAVKNGLTFFNPEYFKGSPLIKELSYNEDVYDLVKSRCYSDSLCLFPSVRKELMALRLLDQDVRGGSNDSIPMSMMDSLNRIPLKIIINKIGWPGYKEVGRDGENAAFLIAQHSDKDLLFQKKCLELMKREGYRNNVSKNYYSMIIDRCLVNNDEKQIFGSQVTFDEELQQVVSHPCEYPEEINFIRSLYHLGPIENYLKMMQDKR